jgi:hypothetical protein
MPIKIAAALFAALALSGSFTFPAEAATPRAAISWRADAYVPPEYGGKALPTANSTITASLDLIASNKSADLSNQTIYWYVNNHLAGSGKGKTSVTFQTPASAPDSLALRAEVPGYPGGAIIKSITIPVVLPEAVIVAPLPSLRVTPPSASLLGTPYFFNVSDPLLLTFSWAANYAAPTSEGNSPKLTLNINSDAPQGASIRVTLDITNPLRAGEGAQSLITLTRQ